ncbi:MAG: hypothetical protein GY832_07410 [Chloroflexi bacterium]|nr:hypothetical protein [Chloroflexota bacterium]
MTTIHLDFDPLNAEHRRAADWLATQPDPAQAVIRLIRAASEGERRLQQWEDLATLLASEIHRVRTKLTVQPPEPKPRIEIQEDPESAHRLDTMFEERG